MTEPRFHIGRVAQLSGHSIHTIRWYEAQGLIPGVDRDRGGRRVYLQAHIDHLGFLEHLRLTGMSVAEMKRFSELSAQGWRTLPERQALLDAHRDKVKAVIDRMDEALALIDAKAAYYAEWQAAKKRPPPLPHPPRAKGRGGNSRRVADVGGG